MCFIGIHNLCPSGEERRDFFLLFQPRFNVSFIPVTAGRYLQQQSIYIKLFHLAWSHMVCTFRVSLPYRIYRVVNRSKLNCPRWKVYCSIPSLFDLGGYWSVLSQYIDLDWYHIDPTTSQFRHLNLGFNQVSNIKCFNWREDCFYSKSHGWYNKIKAKPLIVKVGSGGMMP